MDILIAVVGVVFVVGMYWGMQAIISFNEIHINNSVNNANKIKRCGCGC